MNKFLKRNTVTCFIIRAAEYPENSGNVYVEYELTIKSKTGHKNIQKVSVANLYNNGNEDVIEKMVSDTFNVKATESKFLITYSFSVEEKSDCHCLIDDRTNEIIFKIPWDYMETQLYNEQVLCVEYPANPNAPMPPVTLPVAPIDTYDKQINANEALAKLSGKWGYMANNRHLFLGHYGLMMKKVLEKLNQRVYGNIECQTISASKLISEQGMGSKSQIEENIAGRYTIYCITDAQALKEKGMQDSTCVMELFARYIESHTETAFVLCGPENELLEAVNSSPTAKRLFTEKWIFPNIEPEALYKNILYNLYTLRMSINPKAASKLQKYLELQCKINDKSFNREQFAEDLLKNHIVRKHIDRASNLEDGYSLTLIEEQDIPDTKLPDTEKAIEKLNNLIGLDSVKESIINHARMLRLNKVRAEKGLRNTMPPLHMVFTGNPGTGKTTVAECLGEIYASIGILSSGHVVSVDRTKLVGEWIGTTEKNTQEAIERAKGGVLFIDEAYSLFTDKENKRDYGQRVIETLLTYLSLENCNLIVVLAGYSNEMEAMLESNPGLKSRFSYTFHFEDYTPDQLVEIGKKVIEKEKYSMTDEAMKRFSKYIVEAYNKKDEHFGNGRFVTRLITTKIIPSLASRLANKDIENLTDEELFTITEEDIPVWKEKDRKRPIDNAMLDSVLAELDEMVCQQDVKTALRDFVVLTQQRQKLGIPKYGIDDYTWIFTGNSGTGKSTVATLLGKMMQALGLLLRGHFVTINAEDFIDTNKTNTVIIEDALKKAEDGIIYLDLDSPRYKSYNFDTLAYWVRNKIKEMDSNTAVVYGVSNVENTDNAAQNISSHLISFEYFSVEELCGVFCHVVETEYQLEIAPDAKCLIDDYIRKLYQQKSSRMPVNARKMKMLAEAVANKSLLRIAKDENSDKRIIADDTNAMSHLLKSNDRKPIGF